MQKIQSDTSPKIDRAHMKIIPTSLVIREMKINTL